MLDANGTRHHALIGKEDFARALASSEFGWDDRHHELTLAKRAFRFPTSPFNRRPQPEDRRGAAADAYGNIYWVAESRTEILVRNSGGGVTDHFWSLSDLRPPSAGTGGAFQPLDSPPPFEPTAVGGLAVTCAHFLVAGAPDWNGLFVFDLHHGGPPRFLPAPQGAQLSAFDIAAAHDGRVWVLDSARHRLWALDANFDFLPLDPAVLTAAAPPSDFAPLLGQQQSDLPVRPPSPLVLETGGSPIEAISVAVLPDGTVLLLETDERLDSSRVFTYRNGQLSAAGVPLADVHGLIEQSRRSGFRMRAHDMAVSVSTAADGTWTARLFAAAPQGDQSFAFDIGFDAAGQLVLSPVTEYFPMRLFGGKAIFRSGARVFYDSREQWINLMDHRLVRYATEAVFETIAFDGKEPGCLWHRLILDAIIAPGAEVSIRTRVADAKDRLTGKPYSQEAALYRRRYGSEIPFYNPFRASDGKCVPAGAGSWELLLQNARGRYLQMEVTLRGDARVTPRIRAMRLYYPRFSYAEKYLPRVYREDKQSGHFIDRFLANAEGIYTSVEDAIAAMQVLFDPDTTPPNVLEYLGSWLGVALEPSWDERKRRLFLRHASEFFTMRGTRRGLLAALRVALENHPGDDVFLRPECGEVSGIRVFEHFTSRQSAGVASAGRANAGTPGSLPAVLRSERWSPDQGAAELHRRYAEAIGQPDATMPVTAPSDAAQAEAWRTFAHNTLGFIPSVRAADAGPWQAFLRRRYSTIEHLNLAWRASWLSFEVIPMPASIPDNTTALADWSDFQSIVLPGRERAHRFTVFLPVTEQEAFRRPVQEARRDLARRIVALQKPAHTTFDVQFYWTFFRLGDVRLGIDTLLDLGSRSPFLMTPALLDDSFIGSSYLAPNYPQNLEHRIVLGRGHCQSEQGDTQ